MDNNTNDIKLAVIQTDLVYIKDKLNTVDNKVSSGYVTKEEFLAKLDPLQRFVYGLIAAFTTALVGLIVGLVVALG